MLYGEAPIVKVFAYQQLHNLCMLPRNNTSSDSSGKFFILFLFIVHWLRLLKKTGDETIRK